MSIEGLGAITMLDDQGRDVVFDGVMYVPGAGGSFLSRGQLEEMGG